MGQHGSNGCASDSPPHGWLLGDGESALRASFGAPKPERKDFPLRSNSSPAQNTLRALKRAVAARDPRPRLLFHPDRGLEYSAYGFQDFLKANGIAPSMNRPRHCQDNAHRESFFHRSKAGWSMPSEVSTFKRLARRAAYLHVGMGLMRGIP